MIVFILFLGEALQCASQTGCVPVPYEAVAYMVQFGILELVVEVSGYRLYTKSKKDE